MERVKGVDAYIAGLDEITEKAIEAVDELKVISKGLRVLILPNLPRGESEGGNDG